MCQRFCRGLNWGGDGVSGGQRWADVLGRTWGGAWPAAHVRGRLLLRAGRWETVFAAPSAPPAPAAAASAFTVAVAAAVTWKTAALLRAGRPELLRRPALLALNHSGDDLARAPGRRFVGLSLIRGAGGLQRRIVTRCGWPGRRGVACHVQGGFRFVGGAGSHIVLRTIIAFVVFIVMSVCRSGGGRC